MQNKTRSTSSSKQKQSKDEEEKMNEVHLKSIDPTADILKIDKEANPNDHFLHESNKGTDVKHKSPSAKSKQKSKMCKYGYFVNLETIQKNIQDKVDKDPTKKNKFDTSNSLFSKSSLIAKENKGAVNPVFYLSPAFQRFEDTKEDQMYFSDVLVYSNIIYQNAKENTTTMKLIGPIKKFVTGIIMDFIDYKFMMTKIRYLNKSFLVFTQENCHFSMRMDRKAYIKISLMDTYEGLKAMPMLNHPYYKNCTKLTIIYQYSRLKDNHSMKKEYNDMLMIDLFEKNKLFPSLKTLKIYASHSKISNSSLTKPNNPYKPISSSPHLEGLESLTVKDSRLSISWKWMQSITPDRLPNLKYLDVPVNAIYDFKISASTQINYFPNLHIVYNNCVDGSEIYNGKLADRFYLKNYENHPETKNITLIGCDKIEFRFPSTAYCCYFRSFREINSENYLEYDPSEKLKGIKKWNFRGLYLTDPYFNSTRNIDKILKISCKEEQKTSDNERIKEDFNTYKFSSDFIDPIEEFVFPECAFTNHCLFCLTHSPSFENLRVIDLRRNPINSLLLLKQYYSEMRVPMLEELYLDTQVYDDIYNTKLIVLFNKNGEIFFLF